MTVARRLMLPDFPMGTPGQTLVVQSDGTINWGTAGGSSGLPIINITSPPYNAVADNGTTDNGPAFNSALAALKAAGCGELWVPPPNTAGNYYGYVTPIVCDLLTSVRIRGVGYARHASAKPALVYSGTGSGIGFSLTSPSDVRIEGLNFNYNSSSFTGTLVSQESNGSHDCFGNVISGCGFQALGNLTTANLLQLSAWLNGEVEKCNFNYGNRQVIWGDQSASAPYINGSVLRDSSFGLSALNPIYLYGQDCEACSFKDLTFEPLNNGTAGAIEGNTALIYENLFENFFVAEGAANGGTVFKSMYTAGRPCVMIGGEIGGEAGNGFGATGSTAMDIRGRWILIGTQFNGGAGSITFADPSSSQLVLHLIGGGYNGLGTLFAGAANPLTNGTLYCLGFNNQVDVLPYIPPPPMNVNNSYGSGGVLNQYTSAGVDLCLSHNTAMSILIQNHTGVPYGPCPANAANTVYVNGGTSAQLTITPDTGVTINAPNGLVIGNNGFARVVKTSAATGDTWQVIVHS